jgi:hypothetical protein
VIRSPMLKLNPRAARNFILVIFIAPPGL